MLVRTLSTRRAAGLLERRSALHCPDLYFAYAHDHLYAFNAGQEGGLPIHDQTISILIGVKAAKPFSC